MNSIPNESSQRFFRLTCTLAGLVILVLIVYGRAIGFEFTNWDDVLFIVDNPNLKTPDGKGVAAIVTPGQNYKETLFIPITYLSYWVECYWFGLSSRVVHVTNIIIHGINGVLLVMFLNTIQRSTRVSMIAAVLFILHPLQVETVAWALGRKDLLATGLSLGALITWRQWCRPCDSRGRHIALGSFSVFLGILALLAKPTAVVLPVIMLMVWGVRKLRRPQDSEAHGTTIVIPLCLLVAAVCVIPLSEQGEFIPQYALPTVQRMVLWPWIMTTWVFRLIMDVHPQTFYPWPEQDGVGSLICMGGCAAAFFLALLIWLWKREKHTIVVGLLFTAIGFLPTLSIPLHYRHFCTADRYGYFPLIGCFLVVAIGLDAVLRYRQSLGIATSLVLTVVLVVQQQIRLSEWSDSLSLWRAQVSKLPADPYGYVYLGKAFETRGDDQHALENLAIAVQLGTNDETVYFHMGNILTKYGRLDQAEVAFKEALLRSPGYVESMVNLANVHVYKKQYQKAITIYTKALDFDSPYKPQINMNLAICYKEIGQYVPALAAVRRALIMQPDNPAAVALETSLKTRVQH
ncbi:hypothetical protein BVX99_01625 [bacterium F16]|nr:hypothetical protein BVX99_01625 [bacterium F16]